jgi:glycosyltransferase involved in cell wall biosynthesis
MGNKHLYFTVTNDLSFDQRMHRICGSLAHAGYTVTLVGRKLKSSLPLQEKNFQQVRISCIFSKGMAFYAEYNIRLLFFLLGKKMDVICAIDLDTILPCLLASRLKKIKRIYDAHEYFTELKEVRTRKTVKFFWSTVEKIALPHFRKGYTVSQGLADAFKARYGIELLLIRNMPVLKETPSIDQKEEKYLYYQGAVNEARAFEYLIPAMKTIPYKLMICGDGNFMAQLKELVKNNQVEDKVEMKGMLLPASLLPLAVQATLGMGLAEKEGLNQYMALPNKFFDYMHAGLPQLAMNYPEYKKINDQFEVAVLIDDLDPVNISNTINKIMMDKEKLAVMRKNCMEAREIFCWEAEEIKLIDFYAGLFNE